MDVRSMVLGFLMQGSMTGYELKKRFSLSFVFFSGLSYGSIYPALKKMEREGLITMKVEIQDGAPNRKVYTITDSGRKVFLETLRAPFEVDRPKYGFLARLFFFAYLSPEERLDGAKMHLESVRSIQRELKAVEPQIKGRADRYQYLSALGCNSFKTLCEMSPRSSGRWKKRRLKSVSLLRNLSLMEEREEGRREKNQQAQTVFSSCGPVPCADLFSDLGRRRPHAGKLVHLGPLDACLLCVGSGCRLLLGPAGLL